MHTLEKNKRSKINNQCFHLKELEKEELIKYKIEEK